MKNNGMSFVKGKFLFSKNDKREFKKKDGKDSSLTQGIVCYACNGHGHLKKECPSYLRGKGKMPATTLSDLENVIVTKTIRPSWQLPPLILEMS